MHNKPLYDELFQRKENGEKLDFEKITFEELKTLWGLEMVPDSMIAELYDVKRSKVTYKRKKWDISDKTMETENIKYALKKVAIHYDITEDTYIRSKTSKVLFSCDVWKSKNSMRLRGVFVNNKELLKALKNLLKEGDIELEDGFKKSELGNWDTRTINNNIKYLYVEEVKINKLL